MQQWSEPEAGIPVHCCVHVYYDACMTCSNDLYQRLSAMIRLPVLQCMHAATIKLRSRDSTALLFSFVFQGFHTWHTAMICIRSPVPWYVHLYGISTCIWPFVAMHTCNNHLYQKPGFTCTSMQYCYVHLYCNACMQQHFRPEAGNAMSTDCDECIHCTHVSNRDMSSLHRKAKLTCSMHSSGCIWRMHILHLITQDWKASRSACIAIGSAVYTHHY